LGDLLKQNAAESLAILGTKKALNTKNHCPKVDNSPDLVTLKI
jgi:hypothetical protein